MSDAQAASARPGRGSLLYDPKARGLFFQVLLIGALVAFFWWIIYNTAANLETTGKTLSFGFLDEFAEFKILTTLGTYVMNYTPGSSTYMDVFWVGVINTFIVAILGIIAATILGFIMGVFRLSNNIVLRGFATIYIEILRNVPLLLQLFFWYFAVLRLLPKKNDQIPILGDWGGINITGLYAPFPLVAEGSLGQAFYEGFAPFTVAIAAVFKGVGMLFGGAFDLAIPTVDEVLTGFSCVLFAFMVALILLWIFGYIARKIQDSTGRRLPTFWIGLLLLIGLPVAAYFYAGKPLGWEIPQFYNAGDIGPDGKKISLFKAGFGDQGMVLKPEMLAVWLALVLYTASFIAEIVRAGILAVPWGQTEAARALGVKPNVTLNKIIIPQAMRVIIPPLTSQYLNLTKNSSLAVAIAYPDIVSVFAGTAMNQIGKEIEMIFMMMMVYLTFSILTSIFMNWYNNRMKLVER